MAEIVLLDLIAGPAASGSPVFRLATGEVCGVLFEGQIDRSAALSAARLMHLDAEGELVVRWNRARPVPVQGPAASAQGSAQTAVQSAQRLVSPYAPVAQVDRAAVS